MAELRVQFSIAMIIAAVAAEVMSVFWYNDHSPWGRRTGDRYMLAALVSDAILVVILKFLTDTIYPIGRWEDAVIFCLCLALIYATLEAPHVVHNGRSFSYFFFHATHKFLVLFVMVLCLFHFRYLG